MICPTPKEVRQVLTALEPQRIDRLFKVTLGLRREEQWLKPLAKSDELLIYLYETLAHLNFLNEVQLRLILRSVVNEAWGVLVDRLREGASAPGFNVSVIDQRYALWDGASSWLDLNEEVEVTKLPEPGCVYYTCCLPAIYLKKQRWLQRLCGGKDAAEHQHHAADGAAAEDPAAGDRKKDTLGGVIRHDSAHALSRRVRDGSLPVAPTDDS